MGEIVNRARQLRARALTRSKSDFAPSVIWENAYNTMILNAIDKIDDEREFIAYVTGRNTFSAPTPPTDPAFRIVVDKYLEYLRRIGEPLDRLPKSIAESALTSDASSTDLDGRRISTMFLHHLSEVLRIKKFVPEPRKVIEIGGGFGGQARLTKLFFPQLTYVIVDLVNSLYCSYVYISANFPDAKILFVEDPSQVSEIDKFDFAFVPTEYVSSLKGIKTDLIVNTASLGEMVQRDVDAFMQFINYDVETKYFYSVNRFARFESTMSLPDQAHTSVKLSADWEILFWDAFGERSFHQLDPVHPPQLELMARKVPRDQQLAQARETIAGLLSVLAQGLPRGQLGLALLPVGSREIVPLQALDRQVHRRRGSRCISRRRLFPGTTEDRGPVGTTTGRRHRSQRPAGGQARGRRPTPENRKLDTELVPVRRRTDLNHVSPQPACRRCLRSRDHQIV